MTFNQYQDGLFKFELSYFLTFFLEHPVDGPGSPLGSSQALQGLILNTVKNKKMEPRVTNPLGTQP